VRGIFVPPGETNATFYDVNQIMHTIWAGAKYDVWTDLSVATSFTYQRQRLPTYARDLHRLWHQYKRLRSPLSPCWRACRTAARPKAFRIRIPTGTVRAFTNE
jgi:hypothetical protein